MMLAQTLIIFDFDGVIADSEYLAAKIHAEILSANGFPLTEADIIKRYNGLNFITMLKAIENEFKRPVSLSLLKQAKESFIRRSQSELHAIAGIREAVEKLRDHYPYCICSNASSQSIKDMLRVIKMEDLFTRHIFSAIELGSKRPKPAPDIFLHAANELRVAPKDCIVVEDSVPGILGAQQAGMRIIGFTGGTHSQLGHAEELTEAGAITVIAHHNSLYPTIKALQEFPTII